MAYKSSFDGIIGGDDKAGTSNKTNGYKSSFDGILDTSRKRIEQKQSTQYDANALKKKKKEEEQKKKDASGNVVGKLVAGVGNFVKDAAVDVYQTTRDTAINAAKTVKGVKSTFDQERVTAQLDRINKERSDYMKGLSADDYKNPQVRAALDEMNKRVRAASAKTNKITESKDRKEFEQIDSKKFAFQAAETALNVGTLGIGTAGKAAIKTAAKQGVKAVVKQVAKTGGAEAVERLIKQGGTRLTKDAAQEVLEQRAKSASKKLAVTAGKDAALGAGYGVTQTGKNSDEDTGFDDYVVNAAFGAGIGAALPYAGAAIKKGFQKAKAAIKGSSKAPAKVAGEAADANLNTQINQAIDEQSDKYGQGVTQRIKNWIGDQVDPYREFAKVDDKFAKKNGVARNKINAEDSLEDLARRSAASEREAAGLFEQKTKSGQSAKDLVVKYRGDSDAGKEFNNYANAKFDLEFREKNNGTKRIQNNIEDEDLDKFVKEYEAKNPDALKDIQTKKEINDLAVDYMASSGAISKAEAEQIKKSYKFAVPLERVFPDDLERPGMTGKNVGSIAKQTVIQRLEGGSDIPLSNSFDTMLNRVYKAVSQGNRAKLAQKILERHEAGLIEGGNLVVGAGNKEARKSMRATIEEINKGVRYLGKKMNISAHQADRLQKELDKLNIEGLDAFMEKPAKTPLKMPKKIVTVKQVPEYIKDNAPKKLDDLKQSYSIKADLLKEYGPGEKGVQQMAADVINGGYDQLMALNPKLTRRTAESIADQILKKPTVTSAKTIVTEGYAKNKMEYPIEYGKPFDIPDDIEKPKLAIDEVKEIVQSHRKRFNDTNVKYDNPKSSTAIGDYTYSEDMIRLAKGKENTIHTYDHESIHKAMGQFLSDKEIETLYKDIANIRGGRKVLQKYYQDNGYPKISWRGAAEEEIANTFANFLKYGDMNINGKDALSSVARKLKLPESTVEVMAKLLLKIKEYFGGKGSEKRLKGFYDKVESGEFKNVKRRTSKYVEPLSIKQKAADIGLNINKKLPFQSDTVFNNLLDARYGSGSSKLKVSKPTPKQIIGSMLNAPTPKLVQIKKKIANREPKLAAKIDEVLNYKTLMEANKVAKMDMKEIVAELSDDPTTGKQVISGIIDGQAYKLEVPPTLAKAVQGLDQQKLSGVLKAFSIVKKPFEVTWTGVLNPVFAAISFAFYDTPMSVINSPQGFKTLAPKAIIESFKSLKSNSSFQRRLAAEGARPYGGSGASSFIRPDAKSLAAQADILSNFKYTATHPEVALAKLDIWGGKLANATRTRIARAAYDDALKQAKKAGENIKDVAVQKRAMENAALAYRTVMPDFDTMSSLVRQVNSVVPFFGASVAGTRSFGKALRRDPVNTGAKALALGIAPTVGVTAFSLMQPAGQEFYKDMEASGQTKTLDNNLIIVLPGARKDKETGKWTGIVKIPLAPEFRAINQTAWRQTRGLMGGEGPNASNVALSLFDTVTGGVRTSENPLISTRRILSGEDPMTGEQIIKGDIANLPKEEQLYASTSAAGKLVGKVLNTSPIQGDKVLGQFGLAGATAKNGGDPISATTTNVKNRLTGARGDSASNAFYGIYSPTKSKRDRVSKEVTDLVKQGKIGQAKRVANDFNDSLVGRFSKFNEQYGGSDAYDDSWNDLLDGLSIRTSEKAFKSRADR